MDRSNFNPDQLHEHFDRLKNDLGVELEDNARVLKLPSGHRFAIGQSQIEVDSHYGLNFARMNLLTEYGRVGGARVTWKSDPMNQLASELDVDFDEDRNGPIRTENVRYTPSGDVDPSSVDHSISWSTELPLQNYDRSGKQIWWYTNPDSDTMDSVVKMVEERGGDTDPETLKNPGVFDVFEVNKNASGEWSGRRHGNISMNRKSGRFEWIPD